MANWLERAKREIVQMREAVTVETAKTAAVEVSAVLAVEDPLAEKTLRTSFVSFDSTLDDEVEKNDVTAALAQLRMIGAAEYVPVDAAFDAPWACSVAPDAFGEEVFGEGIKRDATPAERRELRTLIDVLFAPSVESACDVAYETALASPDNALAYYRSVAQKLGLDLRQIQVWDNRRTCLECRNLSPNSMCLAAWRGELSGVLRDYEPIKDMQQRCEGYAPRPGDPDQREQRFANLMKVGVRDQRADETKVND
jgi:hypothetical protein